MDYLEHLTKGLYVFPKAASHVAGEVDALFIVLVAVCALLTITVAGLIGWFGFRYRAGSTADRSGLVSEGRSHAIEIGWSVALLALFMVLFGWAGTLYLQMYRGPDDARTIRVVGKQWMWKIEHPDGTREINTLHVPVDETVRLKLTSQDVIHSFYVPALRLKHDVLPGSDSSVWFKATSPGEYHLFCAEYCGTDHSRMRGKIVVMQQADYQEWLDRRGTGMTPESAGMALFVTHGCAGCHMGRSNVRAPVLAGIYGRTVPLSDGRVIRVDEAYLRDSILRPRRDVVAGFKPVMPSFSGKLEEGELQSLIAYLKSLQPGDWEQESVRAYEDSLP